MRLSPYKKNTTAGYGTPTPSGTGWILKENPSQETGVFLEGYTRAHDKGQHDVQIILNRRVMEWKVGRTQETRRVRVNLTT